MMDAIARRYMVLPSKLLREGDTFDLLVMDVGVTYEHHLVSKNNKTPVNNNYYNKQDLQQRIDNVRNNG